MKHFWCSLSFCVSLWSLQHILSYLYFHIAPSFYPFFSTSVKSCVGNWKHCPWLETVTHHTLLSVVLRIITHELSIFLFLFLFYLKSKTGVCLLQDGNQEPFKVRLHLARDLLMLQEQDVLCVSGEPFYSGVSTSSFGIFCLCFLMMKMRLQRKCGA